LISYNNFFETDLRCNVKNECIVGKRRKFSHGNKGYEDRYQVKSMKTGITNVFDSW